MSKPKKLEIIRDGKVLVPDPERDSFPRLKKGVPEVVVLHTKGETRILCARVNGQWQARHRLDRRTLGTHEYIEARPFGAPVSAPMLAALESACGRNEALNYVTDPDAVLAKYQPEKIEAEAQMLTDEFTRTRYLRVLYLGLWWGVAAFSPHARRPTAEVEEEMERRRIAAQGAPDIAIV